ncbi:T9SS type B sorting domain-containing protein [Joostella sp. CR20]|uniref:T9SS type B sorting domain-containing protein n=1 Tax=Joostella sp. CR20 TaxID=2804312 RepID=UPI00313CD9FD
MKILKTLILAIVLFLCNQIFAQKESAYWYFGENAGLNFNTEPPTPLTNGKINSREGCTAISDPNGNLLFYTDGVTVWDRNHTPMPNGEGLFGHISSTESAIIIPNPMSKTSYYIFTIDMPSLFGKKGRVTIEGVNYSEVDMTLNSGFGDIVEGKKNIHLITYDRNDSAQKEFKSSEKITAVTNNDGTAVWVITHFVNKFYAFKVDANGVNDKPIISTTQQTVSPRLFTEGDSKGANPTAIGYLKVSPDGKKIAIAHSSTSLGSPRTGTKTSGKALLYDFDNATGRVTNQVTLLDNEYPYGIEFSPNSKVLYVTSATYVSPRINPSEPVENGFLYQFDLNNGLKKTTIDNSKTVPGALQLALNGKIYRTGYPGIQESTSISVINKPNQIGSLCDYSHEVVSLNNRVTKQGLPPFIQSIFYYSFDYENTCLGDNTQFTITSEDPYDTVEWDFGDKSPTSSVQNPTHQYLAAGTYTVTLTLSINGKKYDPLIKQVTISEPPNVIAGPYLFEQCDLDSNPSDGLSTFNLSNTITELTVNSTEIVNANFYKTQKDAIDDTENTEYLDPIYTNSVVNEKVYAKVFGSNPDCYSIVEIELLTTTPNTITTNDFFGCDYSNDGKAIFDIKSITEEIQDNEKKANGIDITVTLHETQRDAAIGVNPLPDHYETTQTTTVYLKAVSGNNCYGGGEVKLVPEAFPQIDEQAITVCPQDFPITIYTGISPSQTSNYTYEWNTNPKETTSSIQVNSGGIYEVTVTNKKTACSKTIAITVTEVQVAVLNTINIDDNDIEVILQPSTNTTYEYAVDLETGIYQSSNTFNDLAPGDHKLFVRDSNNCTTISQTFLIIEFPKLLTPNNDRSNDVWNVRGINSSTVGGNAQMYIFDRYGKLLYSFNPLTSSGWDGTVNGHLLKPDDYWYHLILPNGIDYKGHFAIKI